MKKISPIGADAQIMRVGDLVFVSYGIDHKPPVSEAEAETIALAMESLTNAEIAAARGVSVSTVANQLASAFRKLGVSSRFELKYRLAAHAEHARPKSR
jgi:DNA-binding CsgD family transcriptional regulator